MPLSRIWQSVLNVQLRFSGILVMAQSLAIALGWAYIDSKTRWTEFAAARGMLKEPWATSGSVSFFAAVALTLAAFAAVYVCNRPFSRHTLTWKHRNSIRALGLASCAMLPPLVLLTRCPVAFHEPKMRPEDLYLACAIAAVGALGLTVRRSDESGCPPTDYEAV